MALTRQTIDEREDNATLKMKEVGPVPSWDDKVWIGRLSGDERDAWDFWQFNHCYDEEDAKAGKGKEGRMRSETRGIRAYLVTVALRNPDGSRMYQLSEIALVGGFDGEAIDYLYGQIREYNGLSKKSQEEIEKNSDDGQSVDSGSSSPES